MPYSKGDLTRRSDGDDPVTREILTRYWRGFVGWIRALDTGGIKRVAVLTYFGVYAFLFVAHRLVNQLVLALPARVRPPPVAPVWEVLTLPQSVAMALFSLAITLLVVGAVVAHDALERLEAGDEPVSTDGSGGDQRESEGDPTAVEGKPVGSAGQFDLADAESKVDDEWPGEWVSGDDL